MSEGSQSICDLTHTGAVTTLKGADATGDDLKIYANRTDTYPSMLLYGNAGAKFSIGNTQAIQFYAATTKHFELDTYETNFAFRESSGSPTIDAGYGAIYTKADNNLYFKDGAGVEHTVAFV